MDVIVTSTNPETLSAKRATSKIPIVMMNVSDPVRQGIVASLAHPGGNVTGIVLDDSAEISAKRLQLLRDAVPRSSRIAVLTNSLGPYAAPEWSALGTAAQSLNMKLQSIEVRSPSEYEGAFDSMTRERPDALFLAASNALHFSNRRLIAELAVKNRLPTASGFKEITEVGALMSYSSNRVARFRHAAIYVGKILKGANPAALPVVQPTKYELVIHLKTAQALNLDLPRDLLLVADELIE